MKNVTLITFSPTGGTAKCAKVLAESIGKVASKIDLTKRDLEPTVVNPDTIAIIAVPSYSGRVPALAVERLKKVKAKVNGTLAVIMSVYGNRAYEDTLVELEDVAKECGFKIIAGISAVARHSIVHKIATERPDKQDVEVLKDFGSQILVKLSSIENETKSDADTVPDAKIPGNRPYKKSGPGLTPKTNKKCNDCGKCANECPSGAISKEDPRKINKDVCIQCVRCVEVCPHDAKYLPSLMVSLVGLVLKKPCSTRKEPELFL